MNNLFEGMRPNDLQGMVRALVSVDHYESKIDDTATVVAFMVRDVNAANDLNRFIQKSHVKLLDTEVSAAPNQEGYYFVFVEMNTNDQLPHNVEEICRDISALTGIEKWTVDVRGDAASSQMTADQIESFVSDRINSSMDKVLQDSNLNHVSVEESIWLAESDEDSISFTLTDYGDISQVLLRNNLYTSPIEESVQSLVVCSRLRKMLGEHWSVNKLGSRYLLNNERTSQSLLIDIQKN